MRLFLFFFNSKLSAERETKCKFSSDNPSFLYSFDFWVVEPLTVQYRSGSEDGAHNKTKWPQGNAFHLIYTDFLAGESQRPFSQSVEVFDTCPI